MKSYSPRLLVLAAAVLGVTSAGFAATDTAAVTAEVITPITITKTADLDFGKFAAGFTGGTVVIATSGARSATSDVILSTVSDGAKASFDLTGDSGATYSISIESPIALSGPGPDMAVNTFLSTATGMLTGGAETVDVGGTLVVAGAATQTIGSYTGTVDVTVEYN